MYTIYISMLYNTENIAIDYIDCFLVDFRFKNKNNGFLLTLTSLLVHHITL